MKKLLPHIWLILALIVFVFASQIEPFVDEFDVLLGGQYLLDHQMLYVDYFSHHLPLPYYLAAGLEWITSDNLPIIRLLWSLILFGLLVINYRFIQRNWDNTLANAFILLQLILIFGPHNYFFSLKSDSISAHFVFVAVLRLMAMIEKSPQRNDRIWFLISLMIVVHSSLSLWPLSLFLLISYFLIDKDLKRKTAIQTLAFFVLILIVDFIAFRNHLETIYSQIFSFNQLYYSRFNTEFPVPVMPFLVDKWLRLQHTFEDFAQHICKPDHWLFIFRIMLVVSCLWMMLKANKKLFVIFLGALILSSLRGGFYSNFNDNFGFHQLPLMMVITSMCLWFFNELRHKSGQMFSKISLSVYVILISGVACLNGIRYLRALTIYGGADTTLEKSVSPELEAFITQKSNTWILPFGLREMYELKAKNDMLYQYYLPWHAYCWPCNLEIQIKLNQTPPQTILWNPDENIWGHVSQEYGGPLKEMIERGYRKTVKIGNYEVWVLK